VAHQYHLAAVDMAVVLIQQTDRHFLIW